MNKKTFVRGAAILGIAGILQGAAFATVVGFAFVGILNFALAKAAVGTKFDMTLSVVKPFVSGAVMTIVVLTVYFSFRPIIGNSFVTALSILAGGSCVNIVLYPIILSVWAVANL
mgnify:CR=1 FL=1